MSIGQEWRLFTSVYWVDLAQIRSFAQSHSITQDLRRLNTRVIKFSVSHYYTTNIMTSGKTTSLDGADYEKLCESSEDGNRDIGWDFNGRGQTSLSLQLK